MIELIMVLALIQGEEKEFLVDTGSSYVTVEHIGAAPKVGRVRARLADGSIRVLNLHLVEEFSIGDCDLGPIEVLHGSRDLLGMNALGSSFEVKDNKLILEC